MIQVSKRSKRLFAILVGFMMIVSQSGYLSLNKVYAETGDSGATETVYMLTDTLKAGQDYIIASGDSGSVSVLERNSKAVASDKTEVMSDDNGTYIKALSGDVVWTAVKGAGSGTLLVNGDYAIGLDENGDLVLNKDPDNNADLWSYDKDDQYLAMNGGDTPVYMVFAKGFEASEEGDELSLYVESEVAVGQDDDVDDTRGPPAEEEENTSVAEGDAVVDDDTDTDVEKKGTVLAFTSDIHNNGAASSGYVADTAAIRLSGWMDRVIQEYGGIDVMSFCGDMGVASSNETTFWDYTRNVMNVVDGKEVEGVYTTGNHEFYNGHYERNTNAVTSEYKVDKEGLEGKNFLIYCLGTDNWNNTKDNYTTAQVDKLRSYLSGVGTDKPIIVLTHYPLHSQSSMRTTTNAELVIDALNEAAASGKKIVLLWGHNHSVSDNKYDQIFEPGYSMQYTTNSNDQKIIDFYYAAAGCMSDSEVGTGSNYVKGKGLVMTINSQDQLTFTYYNADGVNVTEGGTFSEGEPVNATAISLTPKNLAIEVGASENLTVSYTPADTTNRKVVWTSSDPSIATVDGGKVTGVASGTATITATYVDGGYEDTCEVKVSKPAGQGVTPENGKKYVILASDGYALTSEGDKIGYTNGSSGSQQYNYNGLTGEAYTVGENVAPDRLLWTFTGSEDGTGYYIQSQEGEYLNGTYTANDSGGYDGTLKLDDTPDVWMIAHTSSGANILKSVNASQSDAGDKYLTHGNGSESTENIFTMRSEDNATSSMFYEYTNEGTYVDDEPETPVVPFGDGAIYKKVDQFTDGKDYLIVSAGSAGNAYALTNPGGSSSGASMGSTGVAIKNADVDGDGTADVYITSEAEGIVWTAASNGDGFNITNDGDYLEGKSGEVKIYSSQQYGDRSWTYFGNQLKHNGGQNTYVVYYDNGFKSTYNSTSNKVYIYEKVDGGIITPVEPPVDPPAEGDVYKEVSSLEDGGEYIIAVTKNDDSVYAIENASEDTATITLDVTAASEEEPAYITTDKASAVWKYTASDKYFTNDGEYLYPSSSQGIMSYSSGRAIEYADGKLFFETRSSGTYYITCNGGVFNTSGSEVDAAVIRLFKKAEGDVTPVDPPVDPPAEGIKYKLTDQFADGKEYLIVSAGGAGNAYALTNPGGSSSGASMGSTGVTVQNGDVDGDGTADTYIAAEAEGIVWTAAANGDGFNITNDGDYLEGKSGEVKIYSSQQYGDRSWTYSGNQLKHSGGQNTYVVYYDNGFKSTYNSTSNKIYIYEKAEPVMHEHSFGTPDYEWEDDYSKVTATRACSECGEIETETVDAAGEVTKPATCEAMGETTYTSEAFNNNAFEVQEKTIKNIDALGHEWGEWKVTTSATCTEAGEESRECSRCHDTQTREIEALGHTEEDVPAVAATCTEKGSTAGKKCSVCGEILVAPEETNALGHKWGEWEITKEATCTETGEKSRACERCDAVQTKELEMIDHTIVTDKAVPATCTETGLTEGSHCSVCNEVIVEQEETPVVEHSWKHIVNKAGLLKDGSQYDQCTECKAIQDRKVLAGYATYYVKSLKVSKAKKAFKVKWTKQSKANQKKFNGYQIRYSKNANMSGAKYTTAGKSAKSKKISKLAKKTKYYVQVRTYTKYGSKTFYSSWSAKKTVKTK